MSSFSRKNNSQMSPPFIRWYTSTRNCKTTTSPWRRRQSRAWETATTAPIAIETVVVVTGIPMVY
jgi:hypothetical protein